MKIKRDDQILAGISLVAITVGIAALFLVNKFSRSTLVHYFTLCRQSLGTFLSSTSHLTGILVLGAVIMMFAITLTTTGFAIAKTRRKLLSLQNSSSQEALKRVNQVIKKIGIKPSLIRIVEDTNPFSFSSGFFKKTIVLSDSLVKKLSEKELEAVVVHELVHIKRNHPIKLAFNKIITNSFFFIPIIKELNRYFRTYIEFMADRSVLEKQKTNRHLKAALAKVIITHDLPLLPSFGLRQWELRIKGLNGSKKLEVERLSPKSVLASILVLMTVLGLFFLPGEESSVNGLTGFSSQKVCNESTCNVHCNVDDIQTKQSIPASLLI